MKRGIIRIVAGIIMIVLQLLSLFGHIAAKQPLDFNIWFYSAGITGAILLYFGSRAYRNGLYSQLVLHNNTAKVHTITRWVTFIISALLAALKFLSFVWTWEVFDIYTILTFCSAVSLSVYSLIYMYKKPSCLFSASLIFIGVAYIYTLFSNGLNYLLHLSNTDNFIPYVFLVVIPNLIAGILYIIISTKLYKEDFSTKSIKSLGWTVFALEIASRIVYYIVASQSIYYVISLPRLCFIAYTVILLLYISVFDINTLKETLTVTSDL